MLLPSTLFQSPLAVSFLALAPFSTPYILFLLSIVIPFLSTFDFTQICVVWDDDYRTENGVIQQFCARALDSNEAQRITTCSAGSISEHQGHLMKFFRSYYLSYSYVCQGLVSCLTRLQGRFVQQARSLRLLSCITDMCPVTGMTECQLFHFFFSYRH